MSPQHPPPAPLRLLYHDAHYVAVHKPGGLLMHRSPISRDRVFLLQALRDQLGQRVYPVHRLDRATAGVVVFGLDTDAARRLATRFENRLVDKRYLAVARGWTDATGLIDHPVSDDEGNGLPQPASTRYRRLAQIELPFAVDRYPSSRYSLVQVTPETGRRHQIRKHFKHISHHLIGDTTHGNGRHNRFFREQFGIQRLLLIAASLHFEHPYTGEPLAIKAQLEIEWQQIADLFRLSLADQLD